MAVWTFPWQDVGGDRTYSDADFAQFYSNLFTDGVFFNYGNKLQATQSPTNSMNVIVKSGGATIRGRQFLNTADFMLTVPVASNTQDRTDAVVLQMSTENRAISIVYKKDSEAIVNSDTIRELMLAKVRVKKGASVITNADITDMRADETLGGYSSPFVDVPVSGLEQQYTAMLQTIYELAQANTEANNTQQQTALQTMQATFQTWLSNLQTQLSGDVAGNLQNQINNLLPTHDTGITFEHDFGGYPVVHVFSWEYGLGLVGLGDEPAGFFGGGNVISAPSKVEYLDGSHLKIYLPDDIMLSEPAITDQGDGRYLLTEGHRSVGILIENNGYKN